VIDSAVVPNRCWSAHAMYMRFNAQDYKRVLLSVFDDSVSKTYLAQSHFFTHYQNFNSNVLCVQLTKIAISKTSDVPSVDLQTQETCGKGYLLQTFLSDPEVNVKREVLKVICKRYLFVI